MSEHTTIPPPSELKQVTNFLQGAREIVRETGKKPTAQKVLLAGLLTIIPDEVRASGILKNPARLETVNELLRYQVKLNDRLDFEGSGRPSFQKYSSEVKGKEEEAKNRFLIALGKLPPEERKHIQDRVDNSIKEVEFVEDWIRKKRDTNDMTFKDVDTYRGLVNAISTAADISALLGPGTLDERLKPIHGELNIQDVIDKYAWMSGNDPQTPIERATMIAFNATMDGQIADDWNDRHIDFLMRIPSYGVFVSRMFGGDRKLAKEYIIERRMEYRRKAQELGLGKISAKGIGAFVNTLERAKRMYVHRAKRKGVDPRRTSIREREYAKGNFDPIK